MITFIQAIIDTINNGQSTGIDWRERFAIHHPMRVRSVPRSAGDPDLFIVWDTANDQWGVFSLEKKRLVLAMNDYSGIGFGTHGEDEKNPKCLGLRIGDREDVYSIAREQSMGFEKMEYVSHGLWAVKLGDTWGAFSVTEDKMVVPAEFKHVAMAPRQKDRNKERVMVTDANDRRGLYSMTNQSIIWGPVVQHS